MIRENMKSTIIKQPLLENEWGNNNQKDPSMCKEHGVHQTFGRKHNHGLYQDTCDLGFFARISVRLENFVKF
jgi:hypothetical protein